MTKIWGFDLTEMRWSAFRHENMFDGRHYLRGKRFVIYQLAMLISLAAECTATYSLSKYENQQNNIYTLSGGTAYVHNNPLIDCAIATIVFCVLVATVFGAEFFFLVFWPGRVYPRWYDAAKKLLALVICSGMAVAALASTIVVARQSAWISGVGPAAAQQYLGVYSRPPLTYRRFPQNIAWAVLIWPALLATLASTALMFRASAHDRRYGSTLVRPGPGMNGEKAGRVDTQSEGGASA